MEETALPPSLVTLAILNGCSLSVFKIFPLQITTGLSYTQRSPNKSAILKEVNLHPTPFKNVNSLKAGLMCQPGLLCLVTEVLKVLGGHAYKRRETPGEPPLAVHCRRPPSSFCFKKKVVWQSAGGMDSQLNTLLLSPFRKSMLSSRIYKQSRSRTWRTEHEVNGSERARWQKGRPMRHQAS